MKKFVLATAFVWILLSGHKPKSESVVWLKNDQIQVGILVDVGGRVVWTSLLGHENLLLSDSAQWSQPESMRPEMTPNKPFMAYNGHINWLSPQSEWWIKQDSFPKLKERRAEFPPDPYWVYARYTVVSQTDTSLVLQSPPSPYTHVQFEKTVCIHNNQVHLKTIATNTSKDTVSWGLWFNTRMNAQSEVFVPAQRAQLTKLQNWTETPKLDTCEGYFSFIPETPTSYRPNRAKAFFSSSNSLIAGHQSKQWLIIQTNPLQQNHVHPEQGQIELYMENASNSKRDIQELEMHFNYQAIAPEKSIEASQLWTVKPGADTKDKSALRKELDSILKNL
jgi:hypothetical protein